MKTLPPSSAAFTLIEVALALGVAAFALVGIIGLIPIGLMSHQASTEQTASATLAASVVADLRAAPVAIPPAAKNSPRFQIPLPASGRATHTLFLSEDGNAAGSVDADADDAQNPRYRVTFFITAPAEATQKAATLVRVMVTWPAVADPLASKLPVKFSGSYEFITAFNRN